MEFKDKVIIVTGASEGVGKATTKKLMAQGAIVYGVARRQEKLDALQKEMEAENLPGKLHTLSVDVSNTDQINNLFETIKQNENRLDALVSNAGVMDDFQPVTEISAEEFSRIININLMGNFYLFQAAIPMLEKGGSIVVTASIAGITGGKAGAAYTSSKHAVMGLVKNTAVMYASKGIRVNAVAPGGIMTPMTSEMDMEKVNQTGIAVIGNGAKIDKMMATAEEIADNLVYLISDQASNINGHILVSDAGLTEA
ncbi:MAG: SDR family oxidoreductase [Clostridiaceae bacterium]|nr:SDR family oxidoreductase [Clostridiaceae bacterium]